MRVLEAGGGGVEGSLTSFPHHQDYGRNEGMKM